MATVFTKKPRAIGGFSDPRTESPFNGTTCNGPCRCSGTVTLPNIRQRHPYGTTRWCQDYFRRNAVESANSQLRGDQHFERGYTRVFVRIKNAFLLGFTIFAHNQTCITNHFRLRGQNVPAEYPIVHRQLAADPEAPKNIRAGRRKKKPSG